MGGSRERNEEIGISGLECAFVPLAVFLPYNDESRGSRYSYEIVEANRLAKSLFSEDTLKEQFVLAKLYSSSKFDKVVVLENEEGDIAGIPYLQRFSPNYAKKVRVLFFRKILPQLKFFEKDGFLFLTLTVNHTRFATQDEAKKAVQAGWNAFNSALKRNFPRVRYIKTVEWQKNGKGCHLHVLLCGVKFIEKDWVIDHWIEKSGWAPELKRLWNEPKRALLYLLKYIAKSSLHENKDEELGVSQVVNWATLTRAFSMSKDLSEGRFLAGSLGFPKTNSTHFWVFLGVVPMSEFVGKSKSEILEYIFGKEL